jgi:hypothetical protein
MISICKLRRNNAGVYNVKAGGTYNNHCVLKGKYCSHFYKDLISSGQYETRSWSFPVPSILFQTTSKSTTHKNGGAMNHFHTVSHLAPTKLPSRLYEAQNALTYQQLLPDTP